VLAGKNKHKSMWEISFKKKRWILSAGWNSAIHAVGGGTDTYRRLDKVNEWIIRSARPWKVTQQFINSESVDAYRKFTPRVIRLHQRVQAKKLMMFSQLGVLYASPTIPAPALSGELPSDALENGSISSTLRCNFYNNKWQRNMFTLHFRQWPWLLCQAMR
jgi:hypothetical protein